jgi:UDP-GlcNAc:undecaprenyl-phosphate/decaprenyl-phosphate GlcNAc-1-phosphate transferase
MNLVIWLIVGVNFILSSIFTSCIKKYAILRNIVDDPAKKPNRKFQKQPIPLLGASGFVFSSVITSSLIWIINQTNGPSNINLNLDTWNLFWIVVSIGIFSLIGILDDKYDLKPQYIFPGILVGLLVAVTLGGLKIEVLSSPFQSLVPHNEFIQRGFAFLWLLFCLAATKFLDGLDGLVSTIGIIAFLTIASVSLLPNVSQPLIAMFCLVWASGLCGFLPYNFPNARLYLGEGGSEIIGFMIGVFSILSGAKVATTSSVIGWFILDVALVMGFRIFQGFSPFRGDRMHWHFRLVDLGLKKHQALSLTTIVVLFTAHLGLFFPTEYKVYVGVSQLIFLLIVFLISLFLFKKNLPVKGN